MSFDLRPLLTPSYWLTMDAPAVWDGSGRFLILVFVGMVIAGAVVRRARLPRAADRHEAELYRRVIALLTVMGLTGIVLFFLSFQGIRLFGARFMYVVWLAGTAGWALAIFRYARTQMPAARKGELDRRAREKYLPKRRK